MKIAVPWPANKSGQSRIKESLSLWKDKKSLYVCLVEPCEDKFLESFDTVLLQRNSSAIGTKVKKCFIADMLESLISKYPQEDFYGFGNSDICPVGDFTEIQGYDALVYHRTDIEDWKYCLPKDKNLEIQDPTNLIKYLRFTGHKDKRIARILNTGNFLPPENEQEWTYENIRKTLKNQGNIFLWGQDLFLFKACIVKKLLDEYLKVKDPILGTGGFDPRLSRYCMETFHSVRVLNRIFHKTHASEWNSSEVDFFHNGGEVPYEEIRQYYDHNYIICLENYSMIPSISNPLSSCLQKSHSDLFDKIRKSLNVEKYI